MNVQMLEQVNWKDLKEGDEVWELGQYRSQRWGREYITVPFMYGPFTVIDPKERTLTNPHLAEFKHYPNTLYKWIEKEV